MGHANADEALVRRDIVNPVRDGFAAFRSGKVVHIHRFGLSFRMPFLPSILVGADDCFFLGVNGDDWLPHSLEGPHTTVNELKLCVTIGVLTPFQRFFVRL